ncbi:hypothetical protein [Ectobacillus funiculus]|uniref:hypothetical protein n=1 Tax=Ectobacillus funiculus TaxID=137993 RepID=UPI003618358B
MAEKITQEVAEAYFLSQGCELRDTYKNSKTKMQYICVCGTPDEKDFTHFKRGQRCENCAKKKIRDAKRLDPKEVEEYFREQNCIMLSPFIDVHTPIEYVCSCGNTDIKDFTHFKRGQRCKECAKLKKRRARQNNPQEVVAYFESQGCVLLDEYESYHKRMAYICVCEKEDMISYSNFKQGKRCKSCGDKKKADHFRLNPEYVKAFFQEQGCKLLSPYVNSKSILWFKCSCGRIHTTRWKHFKIIKQCKECSWEQIANDRRFDIEYVSSIFEAEDCLLLSTHYEGAHEPLDYQCSCGNKSVISLANFEAGKRCGCQVRRGEDHPGWTGLTTLKNFLRTSVKKWRQESREVANYTCAITGERGGRIQVHHLYPFHRMVVDIVEKLGIEIHETIGKYTLEELLSIEVAFLEYHNSFGLGVCLTKEVHDEFHDKYGRIDFTPEQFYEFYQERTGNPFFHQKLKVI